MTFRRYACKSITLAIATTSLAIAFGARAAEPITVTARLAQPVMKSGDRQTNYFNREFDDVLASCAQMVAIDIELKPGVQAVRALSREGTIDGAHASFQLNQVYAATEHYVLMEVAFDAAAAAGEQEVGVVRVAYTAPDSGARQTLEAPILARFGASEADVAANTDKTVMVSVIEQSARERAARAVSLRDQGRLEEARALLSQNAREIDAYVVNNPSPALADMAKQYNGMLMMLAKPGQWNEQRKIMRQLDAGGAAFLSGGPRY